MPETDESVDNEDVVETPETEIEQPAESADEADKLQEGAEEEEGEEEHSAPSRRENRVQTLSRRAREAEERAIRAETERDVERRARASAPVNHDETERREQEKMALMDPQERRDYLRDKELREMKNTVAMTQFQMRDAMDKSAFQAKAQVSKSAKRLESKVEEEYQKALKSGNFVPRSSLFAYLRGLELEEMENRPPSKQTQTAKKAAADRVESVKSKPTSAKSDVGGKAAQDERTARMARIEAAERARGVWE